MPVWQALKPRYDAHFIPVKKTGKNHCVSGKPLPHDADFQAAVEGTTAHSHQYTNASSIIPTQPSGKDATAHELVVGSERQALPVAVVWLKNK